MAGLARLIGEFDDAAIMHILSGAAAADTGPEIIQHVAVKSDALARRKANDPDARTFGIRQKRIADARIWNFCLVREFSGYVGRPCRFFYRLGGFIEHAQSQGNSSGAICRHI